MVRESIAQPFLCINQNSAKKRNEVCIKSILKDEKPFTRTEPLTWCLGRLVSQEVLCIGVGIVAAYWIDFGMSYTQGSIAWRLPISLQLILAVSVIILLFGLPESPRWLCKRGREDEAIEVLCQVFDLSPNDEYIQIEMRSIRQAIEIEKSVGAQNLVALFKSDKLKTRRRVILAYLGLFMNQLSGINLVVYYMPCESLRK